MSNVTVHTRAPAAETLGHFTPSARTLSALAAAGLNASDLMTVIARAAEEDLGQRGDLTSNATVDADAVMSVRYATRAAGTVAGVPVLAAIVEHCLGPRASIHLIAADGDQLAIGDPIADLRGPARGVLAIERLSLNLIGHLSGIATVTRTWVDAVSSTSTKIRDTRKTTTGLRDLEKYAVRCGGGVNHRRGLDDAILIKDNHVAAAGGVGAALDLVHAAHSDASVVVQVEVDTLAQLDEALEHGAQQILIDNFSDGDTAAAISTVRARPGQVLIEASGGLELSRALILAELGVDFLSVGALTHSAPTLDIGLDALAD